MSASPRSPASAADPSRLGRGGEIPTTAAPRAWAFALLATLTSASLGLACGSSSSTAADGGVGATGGAGGGVVASTGGRAGLGGASATGGVLGSGGTGGGGGATTAAANLGKSCTTDYDCMNGLVCLRAGGNDYFGVAGPAHGYCSTPCNGAADQKCAAIGGTCSDISPTQAGGHSYYCFQTCTIGSPTSSSKCQGRNDVACSATGTDATSTDGTCFPTCSSDLECPADRTCQFNICIPTGTAPAPDPVGTHCTPAADPTMADTCVGGPVCITLMGNQNFCTQGCVLGSPSACDFLDMSTAVGTGSHGFCGGTLSTVADVGDLGFCIQQCDTANQCLDQTDPGVICDVTNTAITGHGLCSWN